MQGNENSSKRLQERDVVSQRSLQRTNAIRVPSELLSKLDLVLL